MYKLRMRTLRSRMREIRTYGSAGVLPLNVTLRQISSKEQEKGNILAGGPLYYLFEAITLFP